MASPYTRSASFHAIRSALMLSLGPLRRQERGVRRDRQAQEGRGREEDDPEEGDPEEDGCTRSAMSRKGQGACGPAAVRQKSSAWRVGGQWPPRAMRRAIRELGEPTTSARIPLTRACRVTSRRPTEGDDAKRRRPVSPRGIARERSIGRPARSLGAPRRWWIEPPYHVAARFEVEAR